LLGQRADRIDACQAERLAAPNQALDEARFVERRFAVWRAGERGDAASDCGVEFGFDAAQPAGEIDQTGADDQAAGVDAPFSREAGRWLADASDQAIGDEQVQACIETVGRIDQASRCGCAGVVCSSISSPPGYP
jgi:hypothetical protein